MIVAVIIINCLKRLSDARKAPHVLRHELTVNRIVNKPA
jgi:hypothetical protein